MSSQDLDQRAWASHLGRDGHPVRGVVPSPPAEDLRRMWAGGVVEQHRALRVGRDAVRTSRVLSTVEKVGRSGPMTFVEVEHRISQDGRLAVLERQDVVYRAPSPAKGHPADPGATGDPATTDHEEEWRIDVGPSLLFRFSALTYNAHRIHYDADYARDVEGYAGIVVHGPLQAIVMAESLRSRGVVGPVKMTCRFDAPLLATDGMWARSADEPDGTWSASIRDDAGRQTAHATMRRLIPSSGGCR